MVGVNIRIYAVSHYTGIIKRGLNNDALDAGGHSGVEGKWHRYNIRVYYSIRRVYCNIDGR